jgi:hypothetical protein
LLLPYSGFIEERFRAVLFASTLEMETAGLSETLVNKYQSTRRYVPEELNDNLWLL